MTSKYVLVAVLACLEYAKGCEFNPGYNTTLCWSISSVYREGSPDWSVLKVKNLGNQTFQPVRAGVFDNTPNVQSLTIQGLASEMAPSVFRKLRKLQKVELFDNRMKSLPGGLFQNSPVESIYVINCSLSRIEEGTFVELFGLRVLYFRNNSVKVLPAGAIGDGSLEELYLENNGIETIEPFALVNMPKLFRIGLAGNLLTSFDASSILGTTSITVDRLWLNRNRLMAVTKHMFTGLTKLRYLFLEMNRITTVEAGAFEGLPALIGLDVSNNALYTIPPDAFPLKGAPALELFFMHNNRMSFVEEELLERTPVVKYVTVFGNPLQCPCEVEIKNYFASRNITQVCAKNDQAGRPICITSRIPSEQTACQRDVEKYKYLYDDFVVLTHEYEAWETKCQFLEGYEGIAWSIPNRHKMT